MPKRSSPICCRLSFATLLLLLMTPAAMTEESKSVTLELDHVSICGSNLDTLRRIFTDLGMTPDYGGPHRNGFTQMAIIGFDDPFYVELSSPKRAGGSAGSGLAEFMAAEVVPCTVADGANG